MVTLVDGVLANGVVMIFEMDIAFYAIQGMEILSLMIRLRILSIILPISHAHLHNPNTCHTLVVSLAWETISEIERAFEDKQYQPEGILKLFRKLHDDDYTIAITPVLTTKDPVDSLIMEDEHLETISATESDEVIKSSVENLVQIPSESEGIPDKMCDVPFRDNSPPLDISKDQFEGFSDYNNDSTSIDDDSFSIDGIDYVEASPPDFELVSLDVVEIVVPEVEGIDTDILLTIKDDILHEKLLNVNLLIAKNEALKGNPTPSSDFMTKSSSTSLNFFLEETKTFDNSLPESETFCFNLEEISSGSTTTRSDYSLPDYEAFYFDDDHIEEKGKIHIRMCDSLGSDLVVSFLSGTRNKIFDPGIFIEVQSKRFLLPDKFSISFIHDPPFPVIDTLLPFSSENEDKVVNPGILAAGEEKSPHLLSHRGFKSF
ncbi:hypothetical protein Tco_0569003 [Tanacetum coccineum]